jgi:hypothetical protein
MGIKIWSLEYDNENALKLPGRKEESPSFYYKNSVNYAIIKTAGSFILISGISL